MRESASLTAARPGQTLVLGLALLVVNVAGVAAAVMPFLTLTVAYTFLVAARFLVTPEEERLMATITYEHVTKRFDDTVAVDDLHIDIGTASSSSSWDRPGCGKTTALRMLAGLEDVTDGRILIGDRVVNNVAPGKRDLAMVFQSYALYPHMTVYGNLAFSLKNFNVPKAEIDRRVTRGGGRPRARDLLQRKPKQLSGGQRQRSRSVGPSCASRRRSSWTSPSRTSTLRSACRRAPRS